MRFEMLHLSGFGIFAGAELGPLSPTLNVIEGQNEAGKSTTLEFIRALLFGFQTGLNAQRYEPVRGGLHGGWALVRDRHDRLLRIERRASGARSGTAEVTGDEAEGLTLSGLLRGADRRLFTSVFAFSLAELRSLEALQGDDIYGRIYAAGSGTGDVSLVGALSQVTRRADELFRPEARERVLNRALRELETARAVVHRLQEGLDEYNTGRLHLHAAQDRVGQARTRTMHCREQVAHTRVLQAAWPTWVELAGARARLGNDLPGVRLPADAVPRLEAIQQELRAHVELREGCRAGVRRVAAQYRAVPAAPRLLAARSRVHGACARLGSYVAAREEIPRLRFEVERQAGLAADALVKLGPAWNEALLERLDTSIASQDQVRGHRDRLLAARQASISARERQDDAEAVVRRLSALYDREQDLIATRFPEPPPESDFAAKAARLEEARERLGELERCTRELEQAERRPGTPGEPAVPPSAAAPAGWPALLAVALAAVTGWLLREQPVMAALSAGLLLGFAWVWWSHAARETTRVRGARKETEQELVRLRREVETHRTWLDRLCEPYGWTIRETADVREELRLLDAARELRSAYETRLQIAKARQDEWEAACETAEDGEHHLAQLQSAEAAACADWNEWLRQRHLPAGASPETVLSLYHEADRARAAYRERDRHAVQLARLLESQQGYEAEIAVLVREIGWPVSAPEEIPAAVRALPGALESAAAAERERASLLGRARELREEWRSAGMRLRESVAARRVLLGAADVTSEDELRAAAAYQELRDGLLTQIQSGERTLETLSAPGEKRLALEAELMELDQERIELLTATAEAELESAAAELETATREEGRLLERLAALEREELLTARLRELRAKETEVAELAERWAVLRLTQRLLEKTREQFESQRQPGVIRRAGDILKTMTGGRYHRIIAPNGLDQLQLLEAGYAAKPRGWWSRGTAEQLYLALRFAFIEDYAAAPGVEPLPVVMDDVLVHSDGYHRLHRSVEAIAALAQRHQVIYLTCRPADAALLAAADANAQRFRLDAGSFSSL